MREDQVRRLLHDAVADVEPTRDAAELGVPRESARPRSRATWLPAVAAAALVTVLALGGTSWLAGREGDPVASSPGAADGGPTTVRAVVVQQTPAGPRLATEPRPLEPGADPVQAAVTETVSGTLGGDVTAEVVRADGTVLVQLQGTDTGTGDVDPASARLLPQAVVWAVAIALDDPEASVELALDGAAPAELADTDLGRTLRPEASLDVLAPVFLTSVVADPAGSSLSVEGLAAAFEGTVAWELRQDGEVVDEGFTTAQECCTPSPFGFETGAPPGEYELRVAETDPSDGEGHPAYVVSEQVTVG